VSALASGIGYAHRRAWCIATSNPPNILLTPRVEGWRRGDSLLRTSPLDRLRVRQVWAGPVGDPDRRPHRTPLYMAPSRRKAGRARSAPALTSTRWESFSTNVGRAASAGGCSTPEVSGGSSTNPHLVSLLPVGRSSGPRSNLRESRKRAESALRGRGRPARTLAGSLRVSHTCSPVRWPEQLRMWRDEILSWQRSPS